MFMKEKKSGDLIRIEELDALHNPHQAHVLGRDQSGEEEQDVMRYSKDSLVFPSGESLPRCWTDPSYQIDALQSSAARSG